MNQSQSQVNSLLIIVAILAVVGGLTIVVVTSPKSWELGPAAWLQGREPTLTPVPPSATPAPTGTPTATSVPPTVAPSATRGPTATENATIDRSATLAAVPPTPRPVIPSDTLPEDVYGLAVVNLTAGATSARLRNLPNGDQIIDAVPHGTNVTVLFGRVMLEGTLWVRVRLESGTTGWMAEFLLRYTVRRPYVPAIATSVPTSTPTVAPSATLGPSATPPPAGETAGVPANTAVVQPTQTAENTPTATITVAPSETPSETPTETPSEIPPETPTVP